MNSEDTIYSPNLEAVISFLQGHFAGFNIYELLRELDNIASRRGFVWSTIQVTLSEEQELQIHHEVAFPLRPLSLIRRLPCPEGERRVVHEEMVIPPGFQKQGLSGDFMKAYYEQYKHSKVDVISVYASMEKGGYAWAKYGFAAVNYEEVFAVLDEGLSKGIPHDEIQKLRNGLGYFYSINDYSTPFPMQTWAETRYGETLLSGSDWEGILNLNDDEQVDTFETYLYKAQSPN